MIPCQTSPDLWFSEGPKKIAEAKSICSSCPVKDKCYDLAVKNQEMDGIWGGVNFGDPKERPSFKVKFCKKKLHRLPDDHTGMCLECRRISHNEWDKKNNRTHRVKEYKRQQVGDTCKHGHLIEGDNVLIRTYDKAVTCKKCNTSSLKAKPIILPKGVRV